MREPLLTSPEEKLAAFVATLCELKSGSLVAGLYLVGSHALNDVRPGSDIDFLAVLGRPPDGDDLSALAEVYQRVGAAWSAPHLDGNYVLVSDLARPAGDAVPALRYLLGERVEPAAGALTPVEWLTLKTRGLRLIGPSADQFDINADAAALRIYCRRNLVE